MSDQPEKPNPMDNDVFVAALVGPSARADGTGHRGHRCTATNRAGERCKRFAIIGGFVCVMHGGGAAQVRQAARQRLLALVDPAIDALLRALESGDPCATCGRQDDMGIVIRAAQLVLDRVGLGPAISVTADVNVTARAEPVTPQATVMRALGVAVESLEFGGVDPKYITHEEREQLRSIFAAAKKRVDDEARVKEARRALAEAADVPVELPPGFYD
jgi:hypothetical protein